MYVKYLKDVKGHKAGETVDLEDAAAAVLLENEIVEKTAAPKDVTDAAVELKATLADQVKSIVADSMADLRKQLTSNRVHLTPDREGDKKEWATAKRYSSLHNFKGENGTERAYRFGMFMLGLYGKQAPRKWCEEHGIKFVSDVADKAAHNEGSNSNGGFLVPDEFQNDLIDLRETYGVFRANTKIVPMASDTRSDPRRVGGLTAYFVGEDTAATQSLKSWDRVRLTAQKLMVLTKYSNELNEDAVLNIGDDLAGEIAYAFALKEDQCGFTGDGSSTYGGITGVTNKLLNVDATIANVKGLTVASGTGYASSYDSIFLRDFNKVVGSLPQYAFRSGGVKWFVSQSFWGGVMQKLAAAAGGNRIADINAGALQPTFLGFPVEISQVLPSVPAVSQVCALFGNLRLASRMGDRRHTTIMMSEHAIGAFEQDEVAVRGTERFDIVVHDVGDSTASPKSAQAGAVAGPIVGLITAAS
jgi:HK97 family phage major capsid protein